MKNAVLTVLFWRATLQATASRKDGMTMKITFLGSSHGVPEANRKCSCLMVEIGENIYFVDMGTPAVDQLRRRGMYIDAVKGIFITHMHGDHTNGLVDFVDLIRWYFKTADPDIFLPKLQGAEAIKNWLAVTGGDWRELKFHPVTEGPLFDDGFLKVTAYPSTHCEKAFSYLVEAEGKAVLFTGDLGHPSRDFPQVAREREIDVAICEAAHFPVNDYLPVFPECKIKRVVINHWSYWNVPDFAQFKKDMGDTPTRLAFDGLVVEI